MKQNNIKLLRIFIFVAVACIVSALFIWYHARFFSPKQSQHLAETILAQADIQINGQRPWDITVHNENLYKRIFQEGSLGLGESYMDGWWDSPSLDQFFDHLLRADLDQHVPLNLTLIMHAVQGFFINLQSKSRAFQVGEQHYDLSNELFELMLDKRMIYSCGYWSVAETLDLAQENKLELICKKLQLKPGMKVLDIGCGWGGLACYMAENYNVSVVGITISREQADYAQKACKNLPIEIRIQDYRDLNEQFDRIVSVGMFEHVGVKNYKEYMRVVHRCLKDDGLFLLHTIGGNSSTQVGDPWITTYIFPNGMLPSMVQISTAIEGLFIMEDWHNFGADYDKTLMAWFNNFDAAWPTIKDRYNDRFYRMWKYYLLSCAGLFRARKAQLWQLVLSKNGQRGGYKSVR